MKLCVKINAYIFSMPIHKISANPLFLSSHYLQLLIFKMDFISISIYIALFLLSISALLYEIYTNRRIANLENEMKFLTSVWLK